MTLYKYRNVTSSSNVKQNVISNQFIKSNVDSYELLDTFSWVAYESCEEIEIVKM